MKKSIFIITTIAVYFMYSCKKDVNNRVANVTYELDSVRMENFVANDSVISSVTIPVIENLIDTLQEYNNQFNGINVNDDSLNIRNYEPNSCSGSGGFYISGLSTIYRGVPTLDSTYKPNGSCGQYGAYTNKLRLSYSSFKKLNNINTVYNSHTTYVDDYFLISNSAFNYTGNTLSSFTKNEIYYRTNDVFYDTINILTNTNNFAYPSNISNQKDIIGIDLNDLFLSSFLTGLFYYNDYINLQNSSASFYGPIFIVNNLSSFNTNCNKLIEDIQFDRISQINTYPVNISAQYTFDATKNNRVNTMKIISTINGTESITRYTFYYKN